MEPAVIMVVVLILALLFELTNGWNDAANAIATVVSTGVLKPRTAVLLSATFNIIGALLSTKVAATVSTMVNAQMIAPSTIAAALIAGTLWNATMTRVGLPISASHALLGSVTGAAVATAGSGALKWSAMMKAVNGLWSSPLIGLIAAALLAFPLLRISPRFQVPLASVVIVAVAFAFKPWLGAITLLVVIGLALYMHFTRNRDDDIIWRGYQLVSCTLMALSHGTNDAQKVMGIITMALISGQFLPEGSAPPLWVILACATTMGIGTYMGGWKVIETLGEKLTVLKPIHGFVAETATAAVLSGAAHLGMPVSTTHTVAGSIMGVGTAKGEVNWKVASKIGMAWVFTIPVTFAVSFGLSSGMSRIGLWPVLVIAVASAGAVELYFHFKPKATTDEPIENLEPFEEHAAD